MGKRRGKKGQCIALALMGLLLWAPVADAEVLRGSVGALATGQNATGASANSTIQDGMAKLYIEYDFNSGTTATIEVEQRLQPGTGNFFPVTGSSQTLTTGSVIVEIENPGGEYQTDVTTCTACNVTIRYVTVGRR
jgi:hypothetical protein